MTPPRRAGARFAAANLAGAAVVVSMDLDAAGAGAVLALLSPYLVFGLAAARLTAAVWAAMLALLVASTAWGVTVAGSSSTGGLVFLWLLPAQWALSCVAALATPGALRRGESDARSGRR